MALRISQGSGATLASNLLNGEHLQVISPVSLYPLPAGTNFIGLASIQGNINATQAGTWNVGLTALTSLASGTKVGLDTGSNFIGLATVVAGAAFPVTDNSGSLTVDGTVAATQSGTWNAGITGLVSLASGTEIRSLATIMNFPATQAVTQSGTWTVGVNSLISLASGTLVGLNTGGNFIGLATVVAGSAFPVTDNGGALTVDNGGTFAVQAAQSGTWTVGVNSLISLASGTFVSLNAGSNHIGSVSIFGSVTVNTGMSTLFPGPNFIGLVTTVPGAVQPVNDNGSSLTVDGTVGVSGLISLASGTFVSLNTGTNFVGLATVIPAFVANYTSFSTLLSASGAATLFTPPSGQRWIMKDLFISSLAREEVQISSSTNAVIPYTALATTGGYIGSWGDAGWRGKAVDHAFLVEKKSTATIAVAVNVRFE